MKNQNSIERRKFLQLSSAAVVAGLAGELSVVYGQDNRSVVRDAAKKVGTIPRRKLGYSQRNVSILLGAGDMEPMLVEAAVLCGVNYWHKSQLWAKNGAPDIILKNREAHICQVTVDRINGNHYQGHWDEESHYEFVKESLKQTGLGYFDDMQMHYGYHNIDELKNDRSFIRAFERLKKEGVVKHLCLSQHSYEGSPQVPGGQSAAEILTAVIDDGLYEHAQFMYSYGDEPAIEKFIEYAKSKNFGTIAMKTARGIGRMKDDQSFMNKIPGGTSPHNALVRWLTTKTKLDAAVVRVRNIDEFTDTYSGAGKELRAEDMKSIGIMTAIADKSVCRMCGQCQGHCPLHIPITDILRFERYALDDHDVCKARQFYSGLPVRGDICDNCGICVEHCPLHLPIPEKLAKDHILLG
jgi:predicted aldo/keto reductase-like oxidoreductase